MTPIVKHNKFASQINITPIYPDTQVVIRETPKGVLLYENSELVAWLSFPTMKVVRGLRTMYPQAKLELI